MSTATGSITASTSHADFVSTGEYSISFSFNGTFAGISVSFLVSDDGTNFYPCRAFSRTTGTGAQTATLADSTKVMYLAWILPGQTFRIQATAWTSGTAAILFTGTMNPVPQAA